MNVSSITILGNKALDNSFMYSLNNMKNLTTITILGNNLTEILLNAFNGDHPGLEKNYLGNKSITKIGSNAFSSLKNLKLLDLSKNSICILDNNSLNFTSGQNTGYKIK